MDGKAYFDKGLENLEKGEYGKAVSGFDQAIELGYTSFGTHINKAKAHFGCGDFKLAIADYEKAIDLSGSDDDASYTCLLMGLAHFEQARRDWEIALKFDSSNDSAKSCLKATKDIF